MAVTQFMVGSIPTILANILRGYVTVETIEDVIEEFRVKHGLSKIHLSLGPESTPENVRATLGHIFTRRSAYEDLPDKVKYEAHIQRLRDIITELSKLGKVEFSQFLSERDTELGRIRKRINELTDMIPDVDVDYTLKYYIDKYKYKLEEWPSG